MAAATLPIRDKTHNSVDFPQSSEEVVAHAVDELVGALHGFYEPLLFFSQCADDA
jgi:hypothetical protein